MANDNTNNNNPPIADESGVVKVWTFKQNADGSLSPASSGGVSNAVDISDTNGDALLSNGSGALQVAVVSGGGSNPSVGTTGSAAPTSATEIGTIDGSGKLQGASSSNPVPVAVISGGGSNPSVGTNGAAIPTSSTLIGGSDGADLQPLLVDGSGNLKVITDSGSVTGATLSAETTKVIGTVRNADGAGNLWTSNSTTYSGKFAQDVNILGTLGTAFTTAGLVDIKGTDGNVFVRSNAASTFPVLASIVGHAGVTLDAVLGATKPANVLQVGGNDGTNAYAIPLATSGTSVLVSGTVSIGSGPFVVTGNLTNNNAAPSTNNIGALSALANAAAPTWNEGDLVLTSVDLAGNQRVLLHAETTKVIGTVRATGNIGGVFDAVLGAAVPANAIQVGGSDGTDLRALLTSATGQLHVLADSGSTTAVTGVVEVSPTGAANTKTNPFFNQLADGTNSAVLGAFGTAPATSIYALAVESALVAMVSGTPTALTGTGTSLNVTAVSGSTTAVSGVVEVAPTGAANTLSNPFFNVLADNSGHALTVNSTATASKYALDTNILSILGTAPTTAGFLDIKGADGNVFVRQTTASNLNATVVGAAASGAAVVGNPVLVAGKDTSGNVQPIAVSTTGIIEAQQGNSSDGASAANLSCFPNSSGGPNCPLQVGPYFYNGTTWDRARGAGIGNAVAATGIAAAAAYVQYNTTLPAPTAAQYTAAQCDTVGSTYVNIEGRKATYSAFASFTAVAGDIAVLPGSASKTIRVIRVEVSFTTSGTAAVEAVQLIKRSAADTSGTSAAMTSVPHDSNFSAASALPLNYTVAPTPGAAVGTIRGVQFNDASSLVPGANSWIWDFGARPSAAIVLRGVAQMLCINLPTAVATQTATVSFEWTEE